MILRLIHIYRFASKNRPSLSELGGSIICGLYLARICSTKGRCEVVKAKTKSFSCPSLVTHNAFLMKENEYKVYSYKCDGVLKVYHRHLKIHC